MGRRRRDRSRADHWTRRAHAEGHAARSVYKLKEIHRRFGVIPLHGRVLDLGCSPGSWSGLVRQVAPATRLVGVDRNPTPQAYPGIFIQGSVHDLDVERCREALGGAADLVLSDMAPDTTGDRLVDHVRQVELATRALDLARALLRPGGDFVCKVFDGVDAPAFVARVREHFDRLRRVRPEATRKESIEFFVVAQGFR